MCTHLERERERATPLLPPIDVRIYGIEDDLCLFGHAMEGHRVRTF